MPTFASSSKAQIRYIPEVTFGTTPVSGNPRELRVTGESMKFAVTKTESKEINNYRAVESVVVTDVGVSGDLNGEMQYAEYDPLIAATLQSTYSAVGTNGVTSSISITATATTFAGTGVGTGLVAGQFFTLGGTSNANLDGVLFRCSKTTAPTANLITLHTSTPGVVGGPYASGVVKAARLVPGTTQTSYTIERGHSDVNEFMAFKGCVPSKFSLSAGSGALTTFNVSFMGKTATRATSTQLPGTPVASQTYEVMSGVSGSSCAVWAGGVPLTGTYVKSVKFDYDNSLRTQSAICNLGPVGIGVGNIVAKATLEIYFASGATFFSDLLGNTEQEIAFTAFDAAGNGYVFTLPTANLTDYTVNAGGQNTDLLVTVSFTALRDSGNATASLRQVVFIDRMGAAVAP